MISAWNLPEDFIDIVSRHHEVGGAGDFNPLALVNFSCRMTDALGFAFVSRTDCPSYDELLLELPNQRRKLLPLELAQQIEDKMACIESSPN